ncbi:hypothetical protein WKR88_08315 [Trinickia caryophylli]|uniref:Uncharacterized protein n=1 Tax=Trinickia caryophylli TaxID=28094 RepID=A0A1X7EF98_TRICW|nr:hypothetical protein [Trinickia caryophylli]PMS11119.1 hypothetical protein C0Z17_16675 [Trinickia caryophylli]TRX14574.1 hypothetical protein FNF07_25300 [Trinickia caryophylli]WQE14414.1 hypothetical protein U0034_27490 [Trinickia caryophylli]SMF32847.1 hypothetical protein SAMN06295900_105302 [Trinickia caryophylli]GLU32186.1 hypothetical protein Busp01_20280 [Trinickia caryophylli]
MALTAEQVQAVAEVIGSASTLHDAAHRWRERYPDVRTMQLSAADMCGETPALRVGARAVYFVRTAGMCLSITPHADEANALILTEDGGLYGA